MIANIACHASFEGLKAYLFSKTFWVNKMVVGMKVSIS